MAIDAKSIQVCLWKMTSSSMQICYKFVSENPVFSAVSLFFILLFTFSPSFFAFIIYSLLILISAFGFYRVFFNGDDNIVKNYKKNDGDPSNMGSISDYVNNKSKEKYSQKSNIEDKTMECSTRSRDKKIDKSANVEENVKDTKAVMLDSENENAECSLSKANEHGISQIDVGCDEGSKIYYRKEENSETSEDSQEDGDEDEQKIVMDPGVSNAERNIRLETMIARRKARKFFSFQVRHKLMKAGNNDPVEHLASILVPRSNYLNSNNPNDHGSPGSAPPVLVPMHNPFDLPYETHEERPNLTDESFQKEFLAENKDLMLCKQASYSWGALFALDALGVEDEMIANNISFNLRAPQKLKNPIVALGSHLVNKNVAEVIKKKLCQEKEATSSGCSAEDHATQEGQVAQQAISAQEDQAAQQAISNECSAEDHAAQHGQAAQQAISTQEDQAAQQEISNECRGEDHATQEGQAAKQALSSGCSAEDHAAQAAQQGPDSVDIHHKEDKSDTLENEIAAENIGVGSSSSSSSEESPPTCRPDKDAILRSLSSFGRMPKDDDYQVNGLAHDSDQIILNNIKSDDRFLYAARVMNAHARTTSLASDMLVEFSEINSPRSIPSLDEEYSRNEEITEISSHLSRVDTGHESNSREVPEINDQQDISGGVSRVTHNAEGLTSDVLSEKVFEENSINSSDSLSSSKTGLPDSTQTHSMDSNIKDLPDSLEKNKTGNIFNNNLRDSETPMNDDLKKSNTTNNIDNGTPKQIKPRDLPESSGGSNSNSVNHQDPLESSLQNQQNEKRGYIIDYNGESEYQPSHNILSDNPTSIQSNHSLRSPENRREEEVVPEFEFPASSAENEASGVVSEIETVQVLNISSSGSSPKSVLQPKFSSDRVSSMDLNQGTSTEYQQAHPHRLIVDDDSVLPVVDFNHSAFGDASPREDDSTPQPSHVIDRLQSPRFVDALYCMPFQSRLEERQNHDASITTSASSFNQDKHVIEKLQSPRFVDALYCMPFRSRFEEPQNHDDSITTSASSFYQDIHDPYPHQSNFNQEANASNHTDNLVVDDNQSRTNLESVENIEGDNHYESSIEQSVLMEQSNSFSSKSIEDTKEGIREINGQEGTFGTSKSTEGNSESGPDVLLKELHEATLDDISNQPHEAEAKDSSVTSKSPDAVDTSNHIDKPVVNDNQARTNLECVENIEGDNPNESSIKQSVLMGPSNSSSSKSIDDTKESIREINGQEGVLDTSKSTGGNSESGPDVKLKELHEAELDDVSNQPREAEAKDSSVASKALDAVFDQKQTELSNNTGNLVAHVDVDIKEPSDPPLERTIEEGNTGDQNDPVIIKSDDSEVNFVKGDIGEASEHLIRPEDVHNSLELDATSDSKSTADVEGGLPNQSEVESKSDDHE